ncbi:MAG TPA: Uma2 family endonuclease [Pirellulales bacterium]|nr:Uma2 family endonuclease [Pirellulales bacterium]
MALFTTTSNSVIPSNRLFTIADVSAMPRELPSGPVDYELDNGRIITMSPTGRIHGILQGRITAALISLADQQGLGQTMVEVGVILWRNPDRLVGPDVAFFSKGSFPLRESAEGYLETMPDLVFEVRSKNDSAADMQHKVADYLAAGVKQVFVVDGEAKTVARHTVGKPVEIIAEENTLHLGDIIPNFSLILRDFFRF